MFRPEKAMDAFDKEEPRGTVQRPTMNERYGSRRNSVF